MALPRNLQQKTVAQPTPAQTAAGIKSALEDRSQHIRTMAKDLAALAGQKNIPAEHPSEIKEVAPVPPRGAQETISGVTTDLVEQPFFERQLPRREKEPEEPVALPSMAEAEEIVETSPVQEPEDIASSQRSEILERLRNRVGETAHMSFDEDVVSTPPVEPSEPAWPDIPTPPAQFLTPAAEKPPEFTEETFVQPDSIITVESEPSQPEDAPAPFLPTGRFSREKLRASVPPPKPIRPRIIDEAPLPIQQNSDQYREPVEESIKPPTVLEPAPVPYSGLQTYSGDFANHLNDTKASAFSVLAAEQDTQLGSAPKEPRRAITPKALAAIATGLVLLGLAGGGMYAVYQMVMTMRSTPLASLSVPSIIFADSYRQLSGTGPALTESLATSVNEPLLAGRVLITYILSSATGEDGAIIQRPVGGGRVFLGMQLPAPDILLRNIRDEGSVGIINIDNEPRPFFALRVDSYERTFAGMLTWEPLMFRDLSRLYPLNQPKLVSPETIIDLTTSSSTEVVSSSTPIQSSQPTARTRFEDVVVGNRDVRILRDTDGQALMVYGYADKQTLIIARNEAAFSALVQRLNSE